MDNDKIKADAQSLQSDVRKLKEKFHAETNESSAKLEHLEMLCKKSNYWRNSIKTLSNVPGIKQPQWYVVDIPFEYGATSVQAREVNLSANNAFVCTQMQSYYLVTDTTVSNFDFSLATSVGAGTGRTLPCSAFQPYMQSLKVQGQSPLLTFGKTAGSTFFGFQYPEFEFQIEIEGSGRFWCSPKTPAAAFYGENNPLYLGFEGVVENVDKIKVYAYPTTSVNLKGTVRFVLHGYSIGSNITLQSQLG
tara:strand:+ start:3756 stop:4499 length:744 start_codon:yes stop_codon:yes gene_type:complete